jgi:hypothetical protein
MPQVAEVDVHVAEARYTSIVAGPCDEPARSRSVASVIRQRLGSGGRVNRR